MSEYHFTSQQLRLCGYEAHCQRAACDVQDGQETYYIIMECGHVFHLACEMPRHCSICQSRHYTVKQRLQDCFSLFNFIELHHLNPGRWKCAICLNQLDGGVDTPWVSLECGHVFHSHCFEGWVYKRNLCPLDGRNTVFVLVDDNADLAELVEL